MSLGAADPAGPDAFAVLLRRYRRAAGLSQQQLAQAAGLGVRTLRDLERGRVGRPQRATVTGLAEALRLPPAEAQRLRRSATSRQPVDGDPDLALIGLAAPTRVPLPADPPDFSGRDAQLRRLAGLLARPGSIVVVHGPPGIGKTSVVVRAARAVAAELSDGAYFVDLRGTQQQPTTVRSAVAQLLDEFGVDRRRLPGGLDGRLALYRETSAERSAVLVLDDARDAAQVRSLLPVGGDWRVLVSSRRQLTDLTGTDPTGAAVAGADLTGAGGTGADPTGAGGTGTGPTGAGPGRVGRIALGALPGPDARALLAGVVGPDRLATEPAAVDELVRICGGLPLALRIVASRLASRPLWTIAGLLDRLRDSQRRLDGLYAGDIEVRTAFLVSYRQLDPEHRAALRRLALLPWPGYDAAVVADLLDTGTDRAATVVAGLAEAGLLTPLPGSGRYRLHDLLAVFGQERAAAEDSPADRQAALDRVRAGLLATVAAVGGWFPSYQEPLTRHRFPAARTPFGSASAALDWCTAQRRAITWALRCTAQQQRHAEIVTVVDAIRGVANRHHHLAPWQEVFQTAVDSARALGDPAAEARHRDSLGFALKYQVRRPEQALPEHERARRLHAEIGDRTGYAWSTLYTTGALHRCGRLAEALDRARLAADLFAALGVTQGAVIASYAVGDIERDLGQPQQAARTHRRGLDRLADPAGRDRVTAGMFGYRLGLDLAAAGDLPGAVQVLESAYAAFVAEHHPTGIAECLGALSEVLARLGSPRAVAVATRAVGVCHELGDALREAQAWYALGLVARAEQRAEDHARCFDRARSLCAGSADLEARALLARLRQP
ncbi:helix-turn-helix domain-containing protein [Solwaraspora sp. WMMD791]|uniref:helix-turn-helix domain-containing protein n=1 Tax=Solwaraspora sp. WMMD791 TaxID=3016086 RepID=UPI00249BA8E5|nr:helix-turn-helix domain-containing protein [Solwaraspora sp. WMMD791]WFE25452.1 helix-turn-helix domain-containing protein [Solwaraspora sp. WMMD791]